MIGPSAPTTASKRSPKVGLFLPTGEFMLGGATAGWSDLLDLARRAEDLGFDSLWIPDHVLLGRGDESDAIGGWECWSLLAALAAATTRVELGPLVSCAPFRNPALLAKIASTVDEISGGRLVLGLGAGWAESEFRAFGVPFDHRVSRFEDGWNADFGSSPESIRSLNAAVDAACQEADRDPTPLERSTSLLVHVAGH